MSISGLTSASEFWQVNDRQSLRVGVLFTTFSDFFTDKTIYKPLLLRSVLKYKKSSPSKKRN